MILRKAVIASCTAFLAIGLAACGSDDSDSSASATTTASASSSAAASTTAASSAAPTADELKANLDFIADATKSTPEKVAVIVNGEARTANLDQMNAALGGYGKLIFNVTDVAATGDTATANVTIESPSAPGQPSPPLPMTWERVDGAWKLSDATACTLLAFAGAPCAV
ncbi:MULTISPECIES: hypothetical protein [Antrihabitans]|uniref:Low molecular weight antigen MTB12-like C-terminal domain-containing protein n=2 Tax=Antrihabitans TaxID=2799491 RepID=A0A934NTU4_9NOCA|nr:hypothetical protein [Antrihabitans stalagmiti]MBJ8341187.1 hypothetical protein [Antrihabitans stalagmiti]